MFHNLDIFMQKVKHNANINGEKIMRCNLELTKETQNDYPYLKIKFFLFYVTKL